MSIDHPRFSGSSLQLARALLSRESARSSEADSFEAAGALQSTCSRVSQNLCDSMGEGGCNALVTRALALVEGSHPALSDVGRIREGRIQLDAVAAATEIHGLPAVATAIEAMLAALIEVLSRLIGEDMTKTLMDSEMNWPATNGEEDAP